MIELEDRELEILVKKLKPPTLLTYRALTREGAYWVQIGTASHGTNQVTWTNEAVERAWEREKAYGCY